MLNTSRVFDADVVICGGGPAGCAAGLSAARSGKRTILLEMRESLGGLCTNGYICGIAGVVNGICQEWLERLDAKGKAIIQPHQPVAEPEAGKVELEQMLLQAGCRVLYGIHVVDCEREGGRITKVTAYCKSGKVEIQGRIFIDATGDADLAFAAGVPCEVSSAEYCGLSQSVSMGFRLSYVNINRFKEADMEFRNSNDQKRHRSLIVAKQLEAVENGDLHEVLSPGNIVFIMPGTDRNCGDVTLDATHSFNCRCDDVVDLSRQIVEQHRKVIWFTEFLRKYVPGFEKAVLSSFAPMNGIRDSRRIVGEYVFRDIDLASARKFEDGIVQHTEFFDNHVPTPGFHTAVRHIHYKEPVEPALCRLSQDDDNYMLHPFVALGGYEVRANPREYCELPFRSLVAKGVDNLMAVGRCISAEFHALGSIRVIAPSMGMGQAAGIAASLAIDMELEALRDLDGRLVRKCLIEEGVRLDQEPGGYWEMLRNAEGTVEVAAGDMACIFDPNGKVVR